MQQIALNLLAVGVFIITFFSTFGTLLHISPLVPVSLVLVAFSLFTLDTFVLGNRLISVILEVFGGKEYHQRVIHHEAGHFLTAYLLEIPIIDYSLSTLEAWRKGQLGSGGVILDAEVLKDVGDIPSVLEKLSTVWMGGIAAEQIIYNDAQGGAQDRQAFYATLRQRGLNKKFFASKERFAIQEAKNLLKKHNEAYYSLVGLMEKRSNIKECYQALNQLQISL
jgi:hypothetical protein